MTGSYAPLEAAEFRVRAHIPVERQSAPRMLLADASQGLSPREITPRAPLGVVLRDSRSQGRALRWSTE